MDCEVAGSGNGLAKQTYARLQVKEGEQMKAELSKIAETVRTLRIWALENDENELYVSLAQVTSKIDAKLPSIGHRKTLSSKIERKTNNGETT